ncbi:MAG TPA: glycosyltransferase [Rhodothermales bacterium]|nr:glycosyltransferase [Rhodothermales bacterium]
MPEADPNKPVREPKRIVLLGPMYPYRGGIAHFLETMYRGLQNRGHEVSALTFTRQYPERLFPGKTQMETGQAAHPVPATRMLDTLNPLSWRRTARRIAREQPDLLVFMYWMPFFAPSLGTVARYVGKRGTSPVAVVHNAIPHERRTGDLQLSRYVLNACEGLIVMSESVEQDVHTLGVDRPVRRIAHPIYDLFGSAPSRESARADLSLAPDAPVLLFFGFIRKYKGLQVLLEAMPEVVRELPEAKLLVAGEFYDDPEPYRNLIRKHGLERNVLLHADYIPNDRVPVYFAAADVVVQPYVSATQSGVAQIAFNFDKPLVVTDVGGLAEIVPDGKAGLVVPPEDPAALARAIIRFFREHLEDRLTAGVREEKKKYSWDRLYEAVEGFAE